MTSAHPPVSQSAMPPLDCVNKLRCLFFRDGTIFRVGTFIFSRTPLGTVLVFWNVFDFRNSHISRLYHVVYCVINIHSQLYFILNFFILGIVKRKGRKLYPRLADAPCPEAYANTGAMGLLRQRKTTGRSYSGGSFGEAKGMHYGYAPGKLTSPGCQLPRTGRFYLSS